VIDSFPFDEWSDKIAAFWTFGPENSTGTYVLTVLGVIVMIVSLIGWVRLEDRKLRAQAELLRGGLDAPTPSGEPLAGPSIDTGV
jgi:hypothetical protein